jgi:hypothetical protein
VVVTMLACSLQRAALAAAVGQDQSLTALSGRKRQTKAPTRDVYSDAPKGERKSEPEEDVRFQ